MQRHENESFADYKARRAAANTATKLINAASKGGGNLTSRQLQRRNRNNSKHAGSYGKSLIASFAMERATPKRLAIHFEYLRKMTARKATRAQPALLAA